MTFLECFILNYISSVLCIGVVYIIFEESCSVSNLKAHYFCYLPFPSNRDFFHGLLVFSQQEYYFRQIALFICSVSRIGMIVFGPFMGELLEVRKVSAWYS